MRTFALLSALALVGCRKHHGDACDDRPDAIACDDAAVTAFTCDADGDVLTTSACGSDESCVDLAGCASCVPTATVPYAADGATSFAVPLTSPDATFASARLQSRPVTFTPGPSGGGLVVGVDSDVVRLFTEDGDEVPSGTSFDGAVTLLVVGTSEGTAVVTASSDLGCEGSSAATFDVVPSPGFAVVPLDAYPWIETVDAWNAGTAVDVAVDPDRFPDRVGVGYDVAIVAHKTPDEWLADPTIADVTGTVEAGTVADTVAGGTIEAWTSADADPATLGTGYDVVLDFGHDGKLDPGDFVDGGGNGDGGDVAGLTVFPDLTQPGPHEVQQVDVSGGQWRGQRVYWPTDVATMGELPVVVISHGNGHDYTWYDWLGQHLASWGFAVMAHQNNTGPGIESASTTTLANTDWFLGHLDKIGDGSLKGHVDKHTIVWIGHSRGGEGVVRGYTRLWDADYVPNHYTKDDIVLISSIAPTVFNDVTVSDPHDVPYDLIWGSADGDVSGEPDCDVCQSFRLAQAATGDVRVTYVQGASHNDFNCCGFDDGTGPWLIGRDEAQTVGKGYFLALLAHDVLGIEPAGEYFSRMYDDLHPAGIADDTIVAVQDKAAAAAPKLVVDDFQAGYDKTKNSLGGAVTITASEVYEGKMKDADARLDWRGADVDAMNGMTQAVDGKDKGAGVVFDWAAGDVATFAEELPDGYRDVSGYTFLSLRAAQGTRHPYTDELDAPLDFTVTLVDGAGRTSSIDFADLGGITQPYPRTGLGGGAGWANEFSTVRLRLTDFQADGSGLDLHDVRQIVLELGGGKSSPEGRLAIDDVELL